MNCECCGKRKHRKNLVLVGGHSKIVKEGKDKGHHHLSDGKLACPECLPKELEKLFNQLKACEGQRMSQKVRK